MSNEAPQATPAARPVLSWNDVSVALDELIASTQRTLDVFDHTLKLQGWQTRVRYELLRAAMVERRVHIRMLLVDVQYVTSALPRIMDLLKTHGHQIVIIGTKSGSVPGSNFVVADRQQLLFRPNSVQSVGSVDFSNPYKSKTCMESFEVLWQQGGQRVFPEAFGL